MKILVTGAYGQLGNELKEVYTNFPEWKFIFTDVDSLDITDEEAVNKIFQKEKPSYIINCAAYTAVDKAESDVDNARKINATAVKILASESANVGAKMIHVSTDYVYDGTASTPLNEQTITNPEGAYGKTKLEGESYCFKENPQSVIIRTSWLYSEFGNNFVKTMIRLGKQQDSLNIVFDQVGTPTYAADLAHAILSIIQISEENPKNFVPGIYHYSNEGVTSWFDFAKTIFEITGIDCKVSPILSEEFPSPAKRPHYSVLNKSKIKNTFGLEVPYWRDSLKICLKKLNVI
ncbi:MAG: dTDP-4-dehydrorhamnose reductase [Draconibacterium sp.]